MYSLGNKVYIMSRNMVHEIDIRYYICNTYHCNIRHWLYNYEHLAILTCTNRIILFDGINVNNIVAKPIFNLINWNFFTVFGDKVVIYDADQLHIYRHTGEFIETRKNSSKCCFVFSPDRKKVFTYTGDNIVIFKEVTDFSFLNNVPYGKDLFYSALYWKDDNHLMLLDNFCMCVVVLSILDLNLVVIKRFELFGHNIKKTESNNYFGNIWSNEKKIYLWDNETLLIIDEFYDIKRFDNIHGTMAYNSHHDVFIDQQLKMYRLTHNGLVRYHIEYDYWTETCIPEKIETIIETLIELELFPNDLVNDIYQHIVKIEIYLS